MRLAGKRVIITGGSTGIGAAVARRFLAEGAQVSVWCRTPDNATALAAALPGLSDVVAVDVADAPAVDAAFAQSLKALGGLDTLICKAGISIRKNFGDIDREVIEALADAVGHGLSGSRTGEGRNSKSRKNNLLHRNLLRGGFDRSAMRRACPWRSR